MKYILILRPGDDKRIAENKKYFEEKTMQELVDAYNREAKMGIVGVHSQALHLLALRQEFIERLLECPIYIEDEYFLGLKGEVELVDGEVRRINNGETM